MLPRREWRLASSVYASLERLHSELCLYTTLVYYLSKENNQIAKPGWLRCLAVNLSMEKNANEVTVIFIC